jgi:hypothetical protein
LCNNFIQTFLESFLLFYKNNCKREQNFETNNFPNENQAHPPVVYWERNLGWSQEKQMDDYRNKVVLQAVLRE